MKKNILLLLSVCLLLLTAESYAQKQNGQTKVIAHRGAWKNTGATENSIAALKAAIKLRCYGSEFDVHMSLDSVLFVYHDHIIQGKHIEKTASTELSALKLSNGENLPTLEAYLKAGKKQKKTRLILEIKPSSISKERSLALAEKCVGLVKSMKVGKITDYISFDFDVCKKVKSLVPKAEVTYLNGEKSPEEIAAAGLSGVDYPYPSFQKNPGWIKESHDLKLTTNVWTVNDKAMMEWFIGKKVNYITTNEPELLMNLLK
jgi:glycerophosphoryl diester phosphodiesterase